MTTQTVAARPADAESRRPVVELTGICLEFPGVKALEQVDLRLFPGEVHALLGENGAGKSSLIKTLTGVYRPTGGTILVDGVERRFSGPAEAQVHGISTVYQEVNLCPNLSVAESVMLGHEPRRRGLIDWRATRRKAREHLAELQLDLDPRSTLGSHPIAVQQLVAIARAMVVEAKVLILDEPTSSLDTAEVERLLDVMRRLRDRGVAILFVSHFLDQVYAVSDRMTILRNGRRVGEHAASELSRVELVSMMLGTSAQVLERLDQGAGRSRRPPQGDTPVISARGLGRKGSVEPFDLELPAGQVLGLAGLLGSGRTELARLIYGADRADSGTMSVAGSSTKVRNPGRALRCGIAFSSENRRAEGLIGDLSIRENILLALQADQGWLRRIPRRKADEIVARSIRELDIRPADPNLPVRNLSGGNQQKVLLARWLAMQPKLLILDEPTRGIDVGAKAEVQKLVDRLAGDGVAVIFISAELEEVLWLSDRIAVLRDRRKAAEIPNSDDVTIESLVRLIAGESTSS